MADTNEFKPRPCMHCGAAHGHFTECLHKYERAIATAPELGGVWALCNYFARLTAPPPADAAMADDETDKHVAVLHEAASGARIVEAHDGADAIYDAAAFMLGQAVTIDKLQAALRARAVPEGYAGATVWIGDRRVTQIVSETEIKYERDPETR